MSGTRSAPLSNPSRILLILVVGLLSLGFAFAIAIAITPITLAGAGWVLLLVVGSTLLIDEFGRWLS